MNLRGHAPKVVEDNESGKKVVLTLLNRKKQMQVAVPAETGIVERMQAYREVMCGARRRLDIPLNHNNFIFPY